MSPDFLASEYCYEIEMQRAMQRHAARDAVVIPVILRPCDWQGAPFGEIQAVPKDGKPITMMPDMDQAMLEVAQAVRSAAASYVDAHNSSPSALPPTNTSSSAPTQAVARSSNLRLTKDFSERDKDAFLIEGFEYLSRFFENSLSELEGRNLGIETRFRRVDANRFTAAVYRNGKAEARCTIFIGGHFRTGSIAYVHGETNDSSSFNEQLSVHSDDQALFLQPMGMAFRGRERDATLNLEGAAEFYWAMFVEPLQ